MNLDTNNHSVFLLNYHLVLVIKYRRKVINNEISKNLKENEEFNPSMLYFSLLALWFKELNKESKSKEYIYFILFPYYNVYDKFLVEIKDKDFKLLNIKMIELAEEVIYKFDKYNFR